MRKLSCFMAHRVSLHNHSHYSDCWFNRVCDQATPDRIVENSMNHNIDAVAVTDTDTDRFFQVLLEQKCVFFNHKSKYQVTPLQGGRVALITNSRTRKQIYVYNGIEMHDNSTGHIIVVGYEGSLQGKWERFGLEDRLKLGQDSGGIVIAPHPTTELGIGIPNLEKYAGLIDAAEGFNAKVLTKHFRDKTKALFEVLFAHKSANQGAEKAIKRIGMPMIYTSDSNCGQTHLGLIALYDNPTGFQKSSSFEHIHYVKKHIRDKEFLLVPPTYTNRARFLYECGWKDIIMPAIRKSEFERRLNQLREERKKILL